MLVSGKNPLTTHISFLRIIYIVVHVGVTVNKTA